MWTDLGSFGLVVLAAVLGAVIGLERELAGKPAGLRTHMLVAAAAALLVVLADGVVEFMARNGPRDLVSADPIRVIQAIIVGISFLGAGTIVHPREEQVEGLTTAASVLLTASIGIAVAVGRISLAISTTAFAVAVLVCINWLERYFLSRRQSRGGIVLPTESHAPQHRNAAGPTGD